MEYRCLVGAALLALAACVAINPRPSPGMQVDALVREVLDAARGSPAQQKASLQRAEQALAARASPVNRLRLATLLGTLPAPLRDDARAADLLEPIADPAGAGIGRFAALLALQIAEHARLARELDRTVREHERSDRERDKREEALRQQLDALRAIERGIQEREERLRRPPKGNN
jgi:hypothetical protein